MNICLTIDSTYEQMTRECIFDIIEHRHPETPITFYILGYNLSHPELFYKFERYKNIKVSVISIDPKQYFNIANFKNLRYLSSAMYLRCLIPELDFAKNLDKVIYTDPDIFVLKDLTEFYNEPLYDKYAGVIKDFGILNIWGDKTIPPEKYTHFYSGTMIMDLNKLREYKFTDKCISLIDGTQPDQAVINTLLNEHVQYLSPKYCFSYHKILQGVREYSDISLWNRTYGTNYSSIEDLKNDTVIIHCHGDKKEQMRTPALRDMYLDRTKKTEEFLSM